MNNGTPPQNHSPDFSQFQVDPGFLNSTMQTQKQRQGQQQPLMQQNPMTQWAQANQSMPPHNLLAQQPQFNQVPWPNSLPQAQPFQNAMLQMAPFNMPLISQQIIQEAVAMSTPVDATDEPILLTALLNAKKTGRNFKEALNGLHGVYIVFHCHSRVLIIDFRTRVIPPACGRIIIWNRRTASMVGLICALRKKADWHYLL